MSTESVNQIAQRVQYSKKQSFSYSTSNSTVLPQEVLGNIPDLINPDYIPWFAKQLRTLGYDRFMELVKKARAGSDTPKPLFKWMLQNSEIVK